MKIVFSILIFLTFTSCQKYSEFKIREDGKIFITAVDSKVSNVRKLDWKLGAAFKQTLSKGISIRFDLPVLERKHIKELIVRRKIDSWLVRVRKRSFSGLGTMGYLYIPLVIPGRSSEKYLRVKQIKTGVVNIYYAAAAISNRFENFHCPAFDHSKIIDKVKVSHIKNTTSKIFVSPMERQRIEAKVDKYSYSPTIINGGMKLAGTYVIDIALYRQNEKYKESSYYTIPSEVIIKSESNKYLKGCTGFKIPSRERDSREGIESFKFGR